MFRALWEASFSTISAFKVLAIGVASYAASTSASWIPEKQDSWWPLKRAIPYNRSGQR